jgi:peptide/nickel transport system substrate-binding protein
VSVQLADLHRSEREREGAPIPAARGRTIIRLESTLNRHRNNPPSKPKTAKLVSVYPTSQARYSSTLTANLDQRPQALPRDPSPRIACEQNGEGDMIRTIKHIAVATALALVLTGGTAAAQKRGGVLKVHLWDSPPNMSVLDGINPLGVRTLMSVFNNLVMFDQHAKQSRLDVIVPDLATSWGWNEDGTELTFRLRHDVKWHDGRPFIANDVKCTWELILDTGPDKLRTNTRKFSYKNLEQVTTNGDNEVSFRLKRPQPAFLMLIALGGSPIYPCHVPQAQMRQRPIGTGPFKFVEFKPNESIKLTRNSDYWKPGLPYLDVIEFPIIKNMSTAVLAFASGKFDMIWPYSLTAPLLKDVQSQVPQAICEMTPTGINRHLLVNRDKPPFDDPDLRRAMALSLDRLRA